MILQCLKCLDGKLTFDEIKTYDNYYRTVNALIDEHEELLEDTMPKHLVYSCGMCGREFELTYKEVEAMIRKFITKEVLRMRALRYLEEAREPADLLESNTIILCGECPGWDGDGKCPDRFFKRCELRKTIHGIQLS